MASLRTLSRASTSTIRTLCPLPLTRTRIQPFTHSPTPRSSGHESHYDPPSGWLFGVKPGEKYEKEGWEGPMYWGMCGAVGVAVVAYAFKPDTSIQTWALEEARRRLEAEGILPDPDAKNE